MGYLMVPGTLPNASWESQNLVPQELNFLGSDDKRHLQWLRKFLTGGKVMGREQFWGQGA